MHTALTESVRLPTGATQLYWRCAASVALERSPGLDGTPQHRSLTAWIFGHKRTMYIASAIAAGLLVAILAFLLVGNQPRDLVAGGLDGCIISLQMIQLRPPPRSRTRQR